MHASRSSASTPLRRAVRITASIACTAAIFALGACADTLRSAGTTPASAEVAADQLFEAMANRFAPLELAPKYDFVRVRFASSALLPSRVFNDTSVWGPLPPPPSTARALHISGGVIGPKYKIEIVPSLPPATRLGDTRHTVGLQQLSSNEYRWETDVALASGSITAEGMSNLLLALLRSPEGRTESQLRDDYRAAFPRAMAVFGRGFTLDSLRTTPGAGGTTNVQITLGFNRDLMKPVYPALAGYVDKYLGPARYSFVLTDKSGVVLFDAVGRDRSATVRYRVQHGTLTTLFGPPRAWPDSLQLTSDISLKVKLFRVGFHSLLTDFVLSNTGHDRAWTIVAQHEPKWDLPLITERLIRSSLHRPFEGQGALFRIGVRDSAGSLSMFSRHTRLEVQESAIMKFIGSLVSHALSDLDPKVEAEEDKFLHDAFAALRSDLQALGIGWRGGLGPP